jgi:hypothetical protein
MVGVGKNTIQKKFQKNYVAHKKDEEGCKRHLSTFKKAFLDFMYKNLDNFDSSNLIDEVDEVECSGITYE